MPTDPHRRPRRPATVGSRPTTFDARLLYPTGHGQRSLVVTCHAADRGVVIRLPEFNEAGHYLQDAPVTVVAVSSADAAPVIIGRSHALADRDVDADTASALEQWPEGMHARYFAITPTDPGFTGPA